MYWPNGVRTHEISHEITKGRIIMFIRSASIFVTDLFPHSRILHSSALSHMQSRGTDRIVIFSCFLTTNGFILGSEDARRGESGRRKRTRGEGISEGWKGKEGNLGKGGEG